MKLDVNGVSLYYEIHGQGQPLVMLHGNGQDHRIFTEAASLLSKRFTCYLIDSRGHGQSRPVSSYAYHEMADDVIAFIKAVGLRQPSLYGFSDGGIIGLMVAMKEPGLLSRLVISGANINPRGIRTGLYMWMKLVTLFRKDPLTVLMLEQPHITPEQLMKITTPTLVLAGEKDLIRESHTRLIASSIPGSILTILPGQDHGSYIVHSEMIGRLLLDYLDSAGQ